MARFITFEGGEGCGKSSQARMLYQRLLKLAIPALLTHEPGVTPIGQEIARWLKWAQDIKLCPTAELLLFNASRAQHISEIIRPALASGKTVICDRYADSTTAYQGYGRGLDMAMVTAVNQAGTMGLKPDLTILLDIPVEEGFARKGRSKPDRFEREDISFHQQVRQGYLKLVADEPERWLVVDATQSRDRIADIIWHKASQLLARPE